MFRTVISSAGPICNNSVSVLNALPSPVCGKCVRYSTKPRWLPIAKSKMFRIPVKPVIPIEEKIELQRLHNSYKTQLRSVRSYLREVLGVNTIKIDEAAREAAEEEDLVRCFEINDKWNAEIAKMRETRLSRNRRRMEKDVLKKIIKKEERDSKWLEKVEEHVKQVKKEAVHFITPETIDKVIDEVMVNVVNHNYAIDLAGNKYEGKYEKEEKSDSGTPKRIEQINQ